MENWEHPSLSSFKVREIVVSSMARRRLKKEKVIQKVGRKEEASSSHKHVNNTCEAQEAWLAGSQYQNICSEEKEKKAKEVEEAV
jgi:hypothetical protein